MSVISFDLSNKIDQRIVKIFYVLKKVADSLNIPFFVVGAFARDLILEYSYDIKSPRGTLDIDLGVEVAAWEHFEAFKDSLITKEKFSETDKKHRLQLGNVFVDIIPFGRIADVNKKISWPPEHEIIMGIIGFKEAYECSITVRLSIDPEIDIKVSSLPGLAIMKIVSWKEKYPERSRDAQDLLFIMQKYWEAGNFDRLYEVEQSLLTEEEFDVQSAGIRLLGRDMATISDLETFRALKAILDDEVGDQRQYNLVTDMIKKIPMGDEKFDKVSLQVEKLRKGFVEVGEKRYD